MKISKETLQEELEWQKELYESDRDNLENNEVAKSKIPVTYYSLGNSIRNIGVCNLLLGKDKENVVEKFSKSVEFHLHMTEKIDEYEDIIEGSWIAHKPLNSIKILYTATLSGNSALIEKATEKTLEISETHPEKHPEWSSHYFYSKALANLLLENEEKTEELWEKLKASSYGENFKEIFEAREKFLTGALYGEEDEVLEGIDQILEHHHNEYGKDASTATDFVSIEGTAYAKIAIDQGIELDLEKIDSKYRGYIPETILEQ